ncbi:MAG TPA: hypothetical protein DEA26_08100 [Oceanospirillales bacterium]|nr:hypothetical protein [Oceanospirillaceae bacterium]HBS42628.1 hypothetical protein [Oceanospirillales bacterium]|tara:strand:- start:10069 stop:11196 length:1128 start_codon:yes stop_codon:yes gene_type:complete
MIPAVLMGLLLSAGVVSADETAAAGAAHKDVSSLIPDAPDTDGDGIADMYEKQIGTNYLDPRSVPLDMDGDGIPDDLDDDTDGDGVPDHKDAFPLIRLEWSDLDGDGLGDNIDSDRDNDGISNDNELRVGTDPNDAADVPPDGDRDLIPDSIDDDWDNDGSENSLDAFPYDPHEWRDLDKDGIGDHVDTDLDGDGISNDYELQLGTDPKKAASVPPDLDADGIPDAVDPDRDNDGYPNSEDSFPDDPEEWLDLDHDGVGDRGDTDLDGDGYANTEERGLGTDERNSGDFPDQTPPVLNFVEWDEQQHALTGLVFDPGLGIKRVWLENGSGTECDAVILYAGHFMVDCAELTAGGQWTLKATDKKDNLTRMPVSIP